MVQFPRIHRNQNISKWFIASKGFFLLPYLLLGTIMTGCGGSSDSSTSVKDSTLNPSAESQNNPDLPKTDSNFETKHLDIQIGIYDKNRKLNCGDRIEGLGQESDTLVLSQLKFYLHDIELLDSYSNQWYPINLNKTDYQFVEDKNNANKQQIAYLNLLNQDPCDVLGSDSITNKKLQTSIKGQLNVPLSAQLTSIKFKVGIPERYNHIDINNTQTDSFFGYDQNTHWTWLTGYRFMMIDLWDAQAPKWCLHLGSKDCTINSERKYSCSKSNRPEIILDNFNPFQDDIAIDLRGFFEGYAYGSHNCHGNIPEIILNRLGLNNNGYTDHALEQKLFKVKKP